VRLKGGDPYIFGRGFEEFIFAQENDIETTYIPGISSMQTSGLNNIPLTHRGVSESLWVITGTCRNGTISDDLRLATQSKATVVIYMGMNRLDEISEIYKQAGKDTMAACIIENGSRHNQRRVCCTAGNLKTT